MFHFFSYNMSNGSDQFTVIRLPVDKALLNHLVIARQRAAYIIQK